MMPMPSIKIVEASLERTDHQQAVVDLIGAYSSDPMGAGKPLDDAFAKLIPLLDNLPTFDPPSESALLEPSGEYRPELPSDRRTSEAPLPRPPMRKVNVAARLADKIPAIELNADGWKKNGVSRLGHEFDRPKVPPTPFKLRHLWLDLR